ncbi:MAG: crossover junction endodeoxyribonuclease RuvC [Nitrospirae bacterium]|nr:MAG: crossover junction endodeoxyribonuclease RuvC [Nitrospirota bacterium]
MKILGIDPGSLNCGYGLIVAKHPRQTSSVTVRSHRPEQPAYGASGRIVMSASKPLHERLQDLFSSLQEVIAEYSPDVVVVERVFFAKSTKSALTLGHARGVILLSAALCGKALHEYSALEVKKAVVGYGRAEKSQVEAMVRRILGIRHVLSPDSADALALALCHAQHQSFAEASGRINPLLAAKIPKPKAKSRK